MKNMLDMARRFLKDEKGTEMVEWAVVGGLIVAVGAAVFVAVGDDASTLLGALEAEVDTAAAGVPAAPPAE